MKILIKRVKNLTPAETLFVFGMLNTYSKKTSNKKSKNNERKKKKPVTHDECTPDKPCLFDLDCPAWNNCTDDKFIQYRIILEKCKE